MNRSLLTDQAYQLDVVGENTVVTEAQDSL